jgi:uncharacterized protein
VTAALALASAVAALAACVQGTIGFGLALLTTPLLALIDPAFVPVALLVSSMPLSALVAVRERAHIEFNGVGIALAGRLIGTGAGAYAVVSIRSRTLVVVVAACVLLAVGASLIPGLRIAPSRRWLWWVGIASGFMGTTAAIGGPPIALLYQAAPGPRLRSTLAVYFLVGTSMSLIALAAAGAVHRHQLALAGVLIPGTVTGFILSTRLRRYIDRGWLRTAVLATSAASALVLLGSAV